MRLPGTSINFYPGTTQLRSMPVVKLFTDASVNPRSKIGYGAYLFIPPGSFSLDALKLRIKVKRFDQTSSTKLELQTVLWALDRVPHLCKKVVIYTDSQNIIGLPGRRSRLEQNNYRSKGNKLINNYKLYQAFFQVLDRCNCEFLKIQGHKVSHQKDGLDRLFTLVDRASRKALRDEENRPMHIEP